MADSTVRKIEYEPKRQTSPQKQKRVVVSPQKVKWSLSEKFLVSAGTLVVAGMMTFLVAANISATAAQHELTNIQQSMTSEQNRVADLQQEIGELTSSSRMNKIAQSKGLTLIEKNIRTIH
ncbi:cell division protein FtsL [Lactobacillus sp. ESL0791]|uniref:cell division protein FtsL n=1 Tax=Lactobacillus sp. ESL0791 TaxID=2983234 RepID=UPI0023F65B67|nr:cell division protein FtsL [Lactobacillus sp. ESL0791]MDF7638804.1 cell division protein FtsL [Lactobacillus sp. ESL0791]